MTAITKPRQPPRKSKASPPADGARRQASPAEAPKLLAIGRIFPHPCNREVSDDDCREMAESLASEGLLQSILVRPHPKYAARGHFQLVHGERRWRAARLAGWSQIAAVVRTDLSDADVVRLMAVENAQRQDLNAIEKARHIDLLCRPAPEGGGLTREAAGKIFGLSGSAASNLVRLLDLPPAWLERVISGETPESFARLLVPYKAAPEVLTAMEQEYAKELEWCARDGETMRRERFEEVLDDTVAAWSRTMEAKGVDHYCHALGGYHGRLFEATVEQEAQLRIVKIPIGASYGKRERRTERRALNVKLYDRLQAEAKEQRLAEVKAGKKPAKNGKPKKDDAKAPHLKRQEKEREEKLARRIKDWRRDWLRKELAKTVRRDDWQLQKFVVFVLGALERNYPGRETRTLVREALGEYGGKPGSQSSFHEQAKVWEAIGTLPLTDWAVTETGRRRNRAFDDVLSYVAQELLWPAGDGAPCRLDDEVVDGLAMDYGLDLPDLWRRTWATPEGRATIGAFFELHGKEQLVQLGAEIGGFAFSATDKKSDLIGHLRSATNALGFPKSLEGGVAAKPPKRKKGALS